MGPRRTSLVHEFLQQKSPEEWFAEEILRCVGVPHLLHPHLKKALLLRRLIPNISYARISEDTLQCLEVIEELDRTLGVPQPTPALCAAYCAVAAELTVAPLRRGSVEGFLEAAHWIWECRLGDLQQSEGRGLLGEGMLELREAIREAVTNAEARDGLLERDIRLEALGEYLDAAVDEMGQPLLQLVAKAARAKQYNVGEAEECTTSGSEEAYWSSEERLGPAGPSGVSSERSVSAGARTQELAQVGSPTSPISTDRGAHVPEAERNETGQVTEDTAYQTYELLSAIPSVEVNKVREALQSSCEDLQKVVIDPLPDALIKAANVQMGMVEGSTNPNDSCENASQTERNETDELAGQVTEDTTYQTYELLSAIPSVEVNNVREALQSSCEDLQKVVIDPLPDALIKAANVQMGMVEGSTNPNDSCENASQTERNETDALAGQKTKDTTYQTYELLSAMPSVEVNKVREALQSSCEDLQKVVIDPLPDALIKAANVQMGMVEGSTNPNDSCENASQTERNETDELAGQVTEDTTYQTYELLSAIPSVEVNNVREALQSSCEDLQKVVIDPLPDALIKAANVQMGMVEGSKNPNDSCENASQTEINETDALAGQKMKDTTYQTYELLSAMPSVEVNKVREALQSSCEGLQKVVIDPLPDALIKAANVQMGMVEGSTNPNDSCENASQTERNETDELAGQVTEDTTYQTYELLSAMPSVEVNKVREALQSSCEDPQKVVIDPLADALIKAANVQMGIMEGSTNSNDSCENSSQTGTSLPASSFQRDAQDTVVKRNADEEHNGIPCHSVPHDDVMATTACPDEGAEDAIECLSGNSTNSSKTTRMSTRNHGVLSPALPGVSKFIRRKIKRWTPLQEDTLRKAVKRHGKGNWKFIMQSYPQIFEDRTEIDLKDKWRNMTK